MEVSAINSAKKRGGDYDEPITKKEGTRRAIKLLKTAAIVHFILILLNISNDSNNGNSPSIRKVSCMQDLMGGSDGNYHRQQILDKHNYLRSLEAGSGWNYGAVYMLRLTYDTQLENYAKNYAQQLCRSGHWGHSSRAAPFRVSPGENLYVNSVDYTGNPRGFDSGGVVKKWYDERQDFDWNASDPNNAAAARGKMIGHWTQVVRADASQVGCWIVTGCQCSGCGKENNGMWSTYMACHYDFGNRGWFPYWPLAYPYKIPSNVPQARRQRCGSCPKGFQRCGTTAGENKRDAHLCSGFWDITRPSPQSDLLDFSIKERHSLGVPSWAFMVRNCDYNNGGCPAGGYFGSSSCWKYNNGQTVKTEPVILTNQCICNGFSTAAAVWFERDTCATYSSKSGQPVSVYTGFLEKNVKSAAFLQSRGHKISLHNHNNEQETQKYKGLSKNLGEMMASSFPQNNVDSFMQSHAAPWNELGANTDVQYFEKPYYDKNPEVLSAVEVLTSGSTKQDTGEIETLTSTAYVHDRHAMEHLFELREAAVHKEGTGALLQKSQENSVAIGTKIASQSTVNKTVEKENTRNKAAFLHGHIRSVTIQRHKNNPEERTATAQSFAEGAAIEQGKKETLKGNSGDLNPSNEAIGWPDVLDEKSIVGVYIPTDKPDTPIVKPGEAPDNDPSTADNILENPYAAELDKEIFSKPPHSIITDDRSVEFVPPGPTFKSADEVAPHMRRAQEIKNGEIPKENAHAPNPPQDKEVGEVDDNASTDAVPLVKDEHGENAANAVPIAEGGSDHHARAPPIEKEENNDGTASEVPIIRDENGDDTTNSVPIMEDK